MWLCMYTYILQIHPSPAAFHMSVFTLTALGFQQPYSKLETGAPLLLGLPLSFTFYQQNHPLLTVLREQDVFSAYVGVRWETSLPSTVLNLLTNVDYVKSSVCELFLL